MNVSDVTTRLRRPEYTGENRCLPCTVVNVAIAAAGAALLSIVLTPFVGGVGFVVALVLIYLRGYLVPGTPTLTKTYFPPWLLRLFGKEPLVTAESTSTASAVTASRTGTTAERDAPTETAADPLVRAGITTPDGSGLTESFAAAWRDRVATRSAEDVDPADVARLYDASEAREAGTNSYVLDGSKSVRWGSSAALVADVAAASLLDERLEVWADYDRDRRQSLLQGLRLCLSVCPDCGGDVTRTQERVDPCCQKPHLVADAVCDSCGAPLADAAVVDDGTTETVHERLLAD